MASYSGRWWIAGGWAIDGWLDEVTRPHHDLDLAVLRVDLAELRRHLDGWTVWINEPGRFLRWDGGLLRADDACFMARPDDGLELEWQAFAEHPESVELMVEESEGETWIYRRDRRLRDRLERLGARATFIAPEVALLYKAPQSDVEHNRVDFHSALPGLDFGQRRWLADALNVAHPGHPWLAALS